MKHFTQPRNAILRETTIESPASPNPSAVKPQPSRKQSGSKENAPSPGRRRKHKGSKQNAVPSDPNSLPRFRSTRRRFPPS